MSTWIDYAPEARKRWCSNWACMFLFGVQGINICLSADSCGPFDCVSERIAMAGWRTERRFLLFPRLNLQNRFWLPHWTATWRPVFSDLSSWGQRKFAACLIYAEVFNGRFRLIMDNSWPGTSLLTRLPVPNTIVTFSGTLVGVHDGAALLDIETIVRIPRPRAYLWLYCP